MNVIQYQDLLKQILIDNPSPEITIPETDLELETRSLPITLPKTTWNLLNNFKQTEFTKHKQLISLVQLFEEVIINNLLCSRVAIMAQIVKVGD